MKEKLNEKIASLKEYWTNRTGNQKFIILGSILTALILVAGIFYFASKTTLVPLYTNLKPSETGSIKESLDEKGIKSEITDGGKTIKVPEEQVDTLLVELAAEGIPKSGNIDYSFFGNNAGFGMTDNEFNVLKLDATQTELAELMKSIDGIEQANVMITLPEKGIFLTDSNAEASASIILQTRPGYEFSEKQIKSLYHLVSKSIPNLPVENIVIRNQFLEYFDLDNEQYASNGYTQQMQIKSQVERDIQRQVQNMLGTLMGFDKVVTSVTADIDFTQENREENLVTPVDEENMRGIAISAHRITETFTGNGEQAEGTPVDPTDTNTGYVQGNNSNGDFEKTEETINNEVNRIRKEIVESPYKIRDLGVQVMVEPPNPDDINSFPEDRKQDIQELLSTIVRTSIDKGTGTDLSDDAIQNKIVVSVQPFNGKVDVKANPTPTVPWWIYVIGGVLLVIIGVLLFLMLRRRRSEEEEDEELEEMIDEPIEIPDLNEEVLTESGMRRKQLEKLAKEKPDEFAKLLRTWIAED
ncbi:flagellar M-ring protein FliF [Bacillus sp. IITD106]|nr:flagellar M-ring protein FliF [Bacillus sp. IITD106]